VFGRSENLPFSQVFFMSSYFELEITNAPNFILITSPFLFNSSFTLFERIVEERKITTEDCLVLGILRIHREMGGLHGDIAGLRGEIERIHKRIDETNRRIDEMNKRIDETNRRIESNFKWTIGMILGTWASLLAILIPILLK